MAPNVRRRWLVGIMLAVLSLLLLVTFASMYLSFLWVGADPDKRRIGVAAGVFFVGGGGGGLDTVRFEPELTGLVEFLPSGWHTRSYVHPMNAVWKPNPLWSSLWPEYTAPLAWWPGWLVPPRPNQVMYLPAPRGLPELDERFRTDRMTPVLLYRGAWLYAVPLWMPIAVVALLTAWLARRRKWAARAGRCGYCSYDLTGNMSGVCPECGTSVVTKRKRGKATA